MPLTRIQPRRAAFFSLAVTLLLAPHIGLAQGANATLQGTITDSKGGMIPAAKITIHNDATGTTSTATSDSQGHFSVPSLSSGTYTLDATASGFKLAAPKVIHLSADHPESVQLALQIGGASDQITVEADATESIAAALAPMDALLSATSARTEITSAFINNFISPVADYGEAVEMAPGTFTTNGNGVGLGQSNTYFRGFPDGSYDIDFDGIPFYDTNTPSHHSWAFFPSQFLGSIDFDRSPGTAATIGPTPFGGSIHLLSKEFSPLQNVRGQVSVGSFNTQLYDGEYDSGAFGPGKKLNLNLDVHHLQSDGYQTWNHQTRNAGAIKMQYKFSEKTLLTGFSGVIWLDANTPNFNATRCQMYGVQTGYTCTGTSAPFAGSGLNFLLTNNSDPLLYLNNQYNYYHVPTDFEYVGLHSELGHGFALDFKPYTYNYDNSEKYSNAVPITDDPTLLNTRYATLGVTITTLCNTLVKNKYTCGVDKYNSYRKYGETSELSQVSKFGILRTGLWYEWANTNRHQYPADPLNNWLDAALPNFKETYVTNSYQPFVQYQFHILPNLFFTPGVKLAYYTIGTKQYADNGGKIGGLGTNNPASFIHNGGSYFSTLPSGDINYRIKKNWSAYVQVAQGSIVPPSAVFDFAQSASGTPVATLPKQQKNTTYQTGTVLKLKRMTLDVDYYHIHFQNSYSSFTPLNTAEPVFFLQPSSTTQGVEGESNIYITHGLSMYLNASYDKAAYHGTLNVACTTGSTCTSATPQLTFTAPSNLWVANTPSDVETEGLTYQRKAWDAGIFNKRVGKMYQDNGSYHNQATIDPFSVTNLFVNYTIRSNSRFDQTKVRLSFNNLFDQHNITSNSIAGKAVTQSVTANGTSYVDPFTTIGQTPISGADAVGVLPGRSVMLSVTFGLSPKR
jgi:iron complex outermembrane receptor protein